MPLPLAPASRRMGLDAHPSLAGCSSQPRSLVAPVKRRMTHEPFARVSFWQQRCPPSTALTDIGWRPRHIRKTGRRRGHAFTGDAGFADCKPICLQGEIRDRGSGVRDSEDSPRSTGTERTIQPPCQVPAGIKRRLSTARAPLPQECCCCNPAARARDRLSVGCRRKSTRKT